jgi:POT family proton-dependent oligopeptide transporter
MAKKKIEPNTVIKFVLGSCFLAAFYVFYYTRFFADAEGLTFVFTLAYLVITFGAIPITYRLVYYDEVIAKKDYLG